MLKKLIFFLFLFLSISTINSLVHKCVHDELPLQKNFRRSFQSHVRYDNHPRDPLRRSTLRSNSQSDSEYEKIRIHLDSSDILADNDLKDKEKEYLIQEIFPPAKEYVESLLKVIRLTSNLEVARDGQFCHEFWPAPNNAKCKTSKDFICGYTNVPKSHLEPYTIYPTTTVNSTVEGGGIDNIDTVLYMSARSVGSCVGVDSQTIAFANFCIRDQYGRPIVGFANICPGRIDTKITGSYEKSQFIKVIIHEIWHALGFSSSLFGSYRYHNGTERPNGNMIEVTERGNSVKKLITEKAVEVAREHFKCNSLNGVEIEDGGGLGTAGSHTEGRIFFGDFMNGVMHSHPTLSKISVAILEDSGWYKGSYNATEKFFFGKDAGCDFATQKCLTHDEDNPEALPAINGPKNHFCNVDGDIKCTADRKAVGYCLVKEFQSYLPSKFQYFSEANIGGLMETNDFCPIYQLVNIGNTRNTDCLDEKNSPGFTESVFGEEYGVNSMCFEGNLYNMYLAGYDHFSTVGKCYRYQCLMNQDGTIGGIKIFLHGGITTVLNNNAVTCLSNVDENKAQIPFGLWIGSIICPADYTMYCDGTLGNSYNMTDSWVNNLVAWFDTYWYYSVGILVSVFGGLLLFIVCGIVGVGLFVWISEKRRSNMVISSKKIEKEMRKYNKKSPKYVKPIRINVKARKVGRMDREIDEIERKMRKRRRKMEKVEKVERKVKVKVKRRMENNYVPNETRTGRERENRVKRRKEVKRNTNKDNREEMSRKKRRSDDSKIMVGDGGGENGWGVLKGLVKKRKEKSEREVVNVDISKVKRKKKKEGNEVVKIEVKPKKKKKKKKKKRKGSVVFAWDGK